MSASACARCVPGCCCCCCCYPSHSLVDAMCLSVCMLARNITRILRVDFLLSLAIGTAFENAAPRPCCAGDTPHPSGESSRGGRPSAGRAAGRSVQARGRTDHDRRVRAQPHAARRHSREGESAGAKCCDEPVCVCVCLSVCLRSLILFT